MNKKEKKIRFYLKRYLLGCDYEEVINGLDKYFKRYQIEKMTDYLFKKSMNLGYTHETDEEIIENALKLI